MPTWAELAQMVLAVVIRGNAVTLVRDNFNLPGNVLCWGRDRVSLLSTGPRDNRYRLYLLIIIVLWRCCDGFYLPIVTTRNGRCCAHWPLRFSCCITVYDRV